MLEGSSHTIIKPRNARSTQNTVPSKEALGFKVYSKMSMAHHFPQGVLTTKGAWDTKGHHCESQALKGDKLWTQFSRQGSILKAQLQKIALQFT